MFTDRPSSFTVVISERLFRTFAGEIIRRGRVRRSEDKHISDRLPPDFPTLRLDGASFLGLALSY